MRRLESLGETDMPSDTIGEIVMETLARIDTVAYVRFASVYKNFQAADDFEDFVSELRPPPAARTTDPMNEDDPDAGWMRVALGLARRGLGPGLAQPGGRLRHRGATDRVVGRGWTRRADGRMPRRWRSQAAGRARAARRPT